MILKTYLKREYGTGKKIVMSEEFKPLKITLEK
jgi:hypothetical protein